jgi:hypothetical protein
MNPYLLDAIEFGPVAVARLIERIPPDRLDVAAEEGRFTPRQVIAHLADWEPIDRVRILAGVNNPGSTIEPYDEMEMARANHYEESDPAERCEVFLRERKKTAELIRGLKADDWSNSVYHPERGTLTVVDLCIIVLGHDLYHIEQLTASLGD